ncbi:MAG: InlB B-repeat-containing protein [Oscillospiraceae bacterium]|nr:InlB B-repeat-containing protein [Oscillospiraceae bacterium]
MKKWRSPVITALILLLTLCMSLLPAFATEQAGNAPLGVLSSDQETYSGEEAIEVKLSAENPNETALYDMTLSLDVPQGYHLEEGDEDTLTAEELAGLDTLELTATLLPDDAGEGDGEGGSEEGGGSEGGSEGEEDSEAGGDTGEEGAENGDESQSGTDTPADGDDTDDDGRDEAEEEEDTAVGGDHDDSSGNKSHDSSGDKNKEKDPDAVQTGDSSHTMLWLALMLASGGGVVILLCVGKKPYKGKRIASLVLVAAMAASLLPAVPQSAKAAELEEASLDLSLTVLVEGEELEITGKVTYSYLLPEPAATYTVTYHSNGGSEIEAETVEEGLTVTVPEVPTCEGYLFAGWYTDEALTEAYDFAAPVTGNLDLYARWMEGETPVLYTIYDEIQAGEETLVQFCVYSELGAESFALYCEGEPMDAPLYDDGDYENHYDGYAGDGYYYGACTILWDEEAELTFTAKAEIDGVTIESESASIWVYELFTEEELAAMNDLEETIIRLRDEAVAALPEDATDQEKADARYNAIWPYLKEQETAGVVSDVTYTELTQVISYKAYGVNTAVICYSEEPLSEASAQWAYGGSMNVNYSTETFTFDSDPATNAHIRYLPVIKAALNDGFHGLDSIYSAKVSSFKNMYGNEFLAIHCHGQYFEGEPVILVEEEATDAKRQSYASDIQSGRVWVAYGTEGEEGFFAVRPSFFPAYYKENVFGYRGKLDCVTVYLSCCFSAYNNKLLTAFQKAGAQAVLGYNGSVYMEYSRDMLIDIVDYYEGGTHTIGEALNYAKQENGADDYVIFGSSLPEEEQTRDDGTACILYGDQNAMVRPG